jgi:hypothetical protein
MIEISQATLDVIESIKNSRPLRFTYRDSGERLIQPTGFFGDFIGFEGNDLDVSEEENNFKRFLFKRVTHWDGVCLPYKVSVTFKFEGYPTDKEVREQLIFLAEESEDLEYTITQDDD